MSKLVSGCHHAPVGTGQYGTFCTYCGNVCETVTTPPDQPEDTALSKAIDDIVFRCFAQGQYWGTELDNDYLPDEPIDRSEANKLLLQLFHAQQAKAVQAARIDELQYLPHDVTHEWLIHRIKELQPTQPPAADTTKQGEGE